MKKVYLDNASTTQLRPEVIQEMTKVLLEDYGNPSSTHSFGRKAKSILELSRKAIAKQLNASAQEIIFTSCGTEANNWILRSAVRDLGVKRIITSKIEHHAVLFTAQALQIEFDIQVDYVAVKPNGEIDITDLVDLLSQETKTLVSLMHVNNEIGTVLDLDKVGRICQQHHALFHSDMVQSIGKTEIDLQTLPIDFMVSSAHKFHGPKGVGFCFVRKESGLKPLIFGGEQKRGYRAGTESTHNIIGMDEALKIAYDNLGEEKNYVSGLKSYFIKQLKEHLGDVSFNGGCEDATNSTYTLVNVCLPIAPEKAPMLQFQLDLKGVACSKGSACQSGSNQQSHVLTALLDEDHQKRPSVRFSFSIYNTKEELDYVVSVLKEFVNS